MASVWHPAQLPSLFLTSLRIFQNVKSGLTCLQMRQISQEPTPPPTTASSHLGNAIAIYRGTLGPTSGELRHVDDEDKQSREEDPRTPGWLCWCLPAIPPL